MINDENRKYTAVAYARVSTKNEEQSESCENQIMLCEEYVKAHPNIIIEERYIDDGISGKSDIRPFYLRMLDRIDEGTVDYILVKDCNRLCRSTEISAHLDKRCRKNNVKIIYVKDGSVYDPCNRKDRMVHGIKAVIDEDYIYQQSEAGIVAHHQKCMKKILDATDVRYGYYWDYKNKFMAVDDEEAQYVKLMFEWYVFGGLGVTEIARKLGELGVYGQKSGKLLTANTISSRLADSSYMGVFYINKRGSELEVGTSAKTKRFERPKEEWVAVEGPAIITKELFELAQRVREERKHVYDKPSKEASQARFKGTHLFASKVFCGSCGTQFHFRYSDRAKTIGEYKDVYGRIRRTLDIECQNTEHNRIREDTLINICKYSINVFLANHEECLNNLINVIRDASAEAMNDTTELKTLKKKLSKVEKEIKKNLEAWKEAPSDMKEDFHKMYQDNKEQKTQLEKSIAEFEARKVSVDNLEQELEVIKTKIDGMKQIKEITREVVENFIDKIVIHEDGKVAVMLKFGTSFDAILCQFMTTHISSSLYLDAEKISNLKFITTKENINENILFYKLGSCLDEARRGAEYGAW